MAVTFEIFYNKLKEKVVNILKEQEVKEGNLCFDKIVGETLKELLLEDLDIERIQLEPEDKENYPIKNVLTRKDTKKSISQLNYRRLNK